MPFSAKLSFSDNPQRVALEFPLDSVYRFTSDTESLAALRKAETLDLLLIEIQGSQEGRDGLGSEVSRLLPPFQMDKQEVVDTAARIDAIERRLALLRAVQFESSLYEKGMGSSQAVIGSFMDLMHAYDAD